jgi:hypothetical protein
MLVLDKSGSMMSKWDHDADESTAEITRWNSVYNVTQTILGGFAQTLDFGAVLFPALDADLGDNYAHACDMSEAPEVAIAPDNGVAILDAIPGPLAQVDGGTPARTAILNASADLAAQATLVPKAIILVTDGAPNCSEGSEGYDKVKVYDDGVVDAVVSTYAGAGIPTYVVGIDIYSGPHNAPAVDPYDAITDIALAGGVPKAGDEKFYNVTNEVELGSALDTISDYVECTFSIEAVPDVPEWVEVTIEGESIPYVEDCEQDGWTWSGPQAIILCGDACLGEAMVTVEQVCH